LRLGVSRALSNQARCGGFDFLIDRSRKKGSAGVMIKFHCPGCGQKLAVKDTQAGKRTKCPSCGDPVIIPQMSVETATAPAPQPVFAPVNAPSAAAPAPARAPAAPNPFGFESVPVVAATAVETVPAVNLDVDLTHGSIPAPRRKKRSLAKTWAVWCAILGALGAAALVLALQMTDLKLLEALDRMFPKADPGTIPGAIAGTIGGLAIAGWLLLLAGRSLATAFGTLLLVAGGGVYGAIKKGEISLAMPILGAVAGILAGALLGALIGAIISANRGRNTYQ
jgi:hypothetical protein